MGGITFLQDLDIRQLDINKEITITKNEVTVSKPFKKIPVIITKKHFVPKDKIQSGVTNQLNKMISAQNGILLNFDENSGDIEFILKGL